VPLCARIWPYTRNNFKTAMMKMARSRFERCLLRVRVKFNVAFIITASAD